MSSQHPKTGRNVRTTKPDHFPLASNDKTHTNATGVGIDSMLGSTILTAENDRSSSQAREAATTNATATTSEDYRTFIRILKALLLLLYLLLCGWILCLCLLLVVTLNAGQSLLDVLQYVFRDVVGFRNWFVTPILLWVLMTRFYLRA